ncbi:MAG: hypothetical protein IKQ61_10190 [Spirochaetales bacterium]|nr:hypothetical protein [Spirochaetales bacterium]
MKKIIITAVSAIAVIASVVGCQIYDSQTNANLYHSGVKLQDLAADYNKACVDFKDASTDANKAVILDILIDNFTEHFWEKTAMGSVKSVVSTERTAELNKWVKDQKKAGKTVKKTDPEYQKKQDDLIARDLENMHSVEWCKTKYKSACVNKTDLYASILKKYNDCSDDAVVDYNDMEYDWNGTLDGGEWSLSSVWEKTYKLRWDYNSKK